MKHKLTYKVQEGGELAKDKKTEIKWPFRLVKNEKGEALNIILISAPFRGDDIMKKYEKFVDKTYLCSAGKKTIGYGTRLDYHPEIKKNVCITEPKATELLRKDLDTLVTPVIKKNIKVKLKQNQIDALYSLIHNIGVNNFINSNVLKLINMRRFTKMKKDWQEFQMGGGRVLPGLQRRRQEELALFFSKSV